MLNFVRKITNVFSDKSREYKQIREKFWNIKDICSKVNWSVKFNKGKKTFIRNGEFPISPKLFDIMRSILTELPENYFKLLEMDILPFANGQLGLELKHGNSLTIIITNTNEIVYVINRVVDEITEVNSGTILMTTNYFQEILKLIEKEFPHIQ